MHFRSFLSSLGALFIAAGLFSSVAVATPTNFDQSCISSVDNATIHVPADVDFSLPNDKQIETGDTLAVYTDEGICAGYGVWKEGEGLTFAAAGPDSLNTATDGYSPGEPLKFKVFDVSAENEVDLGSNATFASCDTVSVPVCGSGTYENDVFVQVAEFQADSSSLVTFAFTASDGWNLISLPVQSDSSFGELLPDCSAGFSYDPNTGYSQVDKSEPLPAGQGTFVQCQSLSTSITGEATTPTIEVEAGWNLVGAFEDTVAVDEITSSPAGIVQSGFVKVSPDAGFQFASALYPGEGYWVRVEEAGTIDLSGTPGSKTSTPSSTTVRAESERGDAVRLTLVDAEGRKAALWLKEGLTAEERSRFELPPVPPGEMFDVRFPSGYVATDLASGNETGTSKNQHQVRIQGAEFPVRVRLDSSRGDRAVQIAGRGDPLTLSKEQPSAQIQQSTDRLRIEAIQGPLAFKLGKSSPNPLRNQARLKYTLAKETDVSIAVYDLLGRRVAQVVARTQKPGRHQTQIDATSLSSGKYFVQMKAATFQETRQLTVVK